MLSAKLKEAAGNSADATLYVDDVFSTWLYTGTGAAQTITNGIDLAGKGGLVWTKARNTTNYGGIVDTVRGNGYSVQTSTSGELYSWMAIAPGDNPGMRYSDISSFNSNGYSLGYVTSDLNNSATTYASWTFRKAAKFFDVQTVTHTNGTANNIDLSVLGTVGMVIAKITTTTGDWDVWHRSLTAGNNLVLNTTAAQSTTNAWLSVSGTTATLSASAPTGTYVIYAYAHDTSSTGIIQCGSFTTDINGVVPTTTLGWEPQYLLSKKVSGVEDWTVIDNMRGFALKPLSGSNNKYLVPNTSAAESSGQNIDPWAQGFKDPGGGALAASSTYIYMAIRRPNKPPTTGTQVYLPKTRTGTGAAATVTGIGFAPDMLISENKASAEGWMANRLAGFSNTAVGYLFTPYTSAEYSATSGTSGVMLDGTTTGTVSLTAGANLNSSGQLYVEWFFKRAPGFFDVVCYTGTGVARTVAHNLTVAPELMIVKCRNNGSDWMVYAAPIGATKRSILNSTQAFVTDSFPWNNTSPTASVFTVGTSGDTNASPYTYVAYLFATLAGISKVGSYTGNGTGQAIACGFGSGGARFVLIKRTDSTGDWYTYDSARGLTSGSSPYLLLNSTAAEVTGNNGVYASSGGFTLGATAITTTNIATATYIFLAVA